MSRFEKNFKLFSLIPYLCYVNSEFSKNLIYIRNHRFYISGQPAWILPNFFFLGKLIFGGDFYWNNNGTIAYSAL